MPARGNNTLGQSSTNMKLGITALALVLVAIGCGLLYWGIAAVQEANASLTWPQAEGRITHSDVLATTTTTRDRNRPVNQRERTSVSYSAAIEYEFTAQGKVYHGSRLTVITEQFGSREFAKATVEKYPVAAQVTVSYHPDNPSQCVLQAGAWGGTGFLFAGAAALIGFPLLIVKAIWGPSQRDTTDPHWRTQGERRRFGLLFRERFIHWEPGTRIHLRRDPLDWFQLVASGLLLGLVLGAAVGLPLLFWFCSRQGPVYIGKMYLTIVGWSTGPLTLLLAYIYRRHETWIDWSQQQIRVQVGWLARNVEWNELQQVVARVPEPNNKPDVSSSQRRQYTGRVELWFAGRRHVMLATEYDRLGYSVVRSKLANVAADLASELEVPTTVI